MGEGADSTDRKSANLSNGWIQNVTYIQTIRPVGGPGVFTPVEPHGSDGFINLVRYPLDPKTSQHGSGTPHKGAVELKLGHNKSNWRF
jgi:hypothetical protein